MKIKTLNEWVDTIEQEETVSSIIEDLNNMKVDGETMQYILGNVGMEDQMLSQLICNYPYRAILTFLDFEGKEEVEEILIKMIQEDPNLGKRISDLLLKADAKRYNL
jgi:hypothetical protein